MLSFLKAVSEEPQEIDEGAGVVEERVRREGAYGDLVGPLADYFFEGLAVTGREGEELLDEEEVEELLLDFGVHEDFIRHVRDQSS